MSVHARITAGAIIALMLTIWGASYFIARSPDMALDQLSDIGSEPATDRGTVSYTLKEGSTAAVVGEELEALGVVRSGFQFRMLAELMGVENSLSADEHILRRNSAVPDVIRALTVSGGVVDVVRVTFPEGIRIEEMAIRAEEAGIGTRQEFLDAAAAAQLPEDFLVGKPEGSDLQGYLFPDTYIFPAGVSAEVLVAEMIATLDSRFNAELRAAVRAQGLTLHQALTMASIVEREAVLMEERPLIASVFLNRYNIGMKLDADPTTQFAAALDPVSVLEFGYWKTELTVADLQNPSPYNTYQNAGLPPGPITNPGLASIEAVANPATTNYFYFVADAIKADGSHAFAETLDQHNVNVETVGRP